MSSFVLCQFTAKEKNREREGEEEGESIFYMFASLSLSVKQILEPKSKLIQLGRDSLLSSTLYVHVYFSNWMYIFYTHPMSATVSFDARIRVKNASSNCTCRGDKGFALLLLLLEVLVLLINFLLPLPIHFT